MSDALHSKYRPRKLAEVVGQSAVVNSLSKVLAKGEQQAFLFSGPSGCGKTTLARIAARMLGCARKDIREVDAATYTGVDDMRAIKELLIYEPFGETTGRAIIVDECHSLSKNAWQSLLKSVEEPPAHVYWMFCTTEIGKVPQTIKTRCAAYTLRSVEYNSMVKLFDRVCEAEGLEWENDVAALIINEAGGSPRQLLVNMEVCREIDNKKEAAVVLQAAQGSKEVIDLCRFLMTGGSWQKAMAIVGKLDVSNPEGIRIMVTNYFAKVALGAKSEKQAVHALNILTEFSQPFNPSDKHGPLLRAIGQVLLA